MPRSNPVITHLARAVEAYAERLAGTDPLGNGLSTNANYSDAATKLAMRFHSDEAVRNAVLNTLKELQAKPPRKPRSVK